MFDERTNALKRKYGEAKIASLLGGIRYSEKMTLKFRVRTMHGSKCRKGSATRTTATEQQKQQQERQQQQQERLKEASGLPLLMEIK